MTLVAGVSDIIHEAKITGNASGPFRLNRNACARGGSKNQAATISTPFVTSAVGISHGGVSSVTAKADQPTSRRGYVSVERGAAPGAQNFSRGAAPGAQNLLDPIRARPSRSTFLHPTADRIM
jgi:hypothetical protein